MRVGLSIHDNNTKPRKLIDSIKSKQVILNNLFIVIGDSELFATVGGVSHSTLQYPTLLEANHPLVFSFSSGTPHLLHTAIPHVMQMYLVSPKQIRHSDIFGEHEAIFKLLLHDDGHWQNVNDKEHTPWHSLRPKNVILFGAKALKKQSCACPTSFSSGNKLWHQEN